MLIKLMKCLPPPLLCFPSPFSLFELKIQAACTLDVRVFFSPRPDREESKIFQFMTSALPGISRIRKLARHLTWRARKLIKLVVEPNRIPAIYGCKYFG